MISSDSAKSVQVSTASGGILPTPTPQPHFQQQSNPIQNQQSNSGRGRGFGRGYVSNKPQCQLCGKFRHLVHRCYHHFNVNFTRVTDPTYSSPTTPSVNNSSSQWDDSSEINVFTYQASPYHGHKPSHSNHPTHGFSRMFLQYILTYIIPQHL